MDRTKKKILVAVDGSNNSKRAVLEARRHLSMFDGELGLLTVVSPNSYDGQQFLKGDKSKLHPALEEALTLLNSPLASVTSEMKIGDAADKILETAEEGSYDLIIMGNRGIGRFSKAFLGSVSSKVLNHSKTSVLIVK